MPLSTAQQILDLYEAAIQGPFCYVSSRGDRMFRLWDERIGFAVDLAYEKYHFACKPRRENQQ